MTSPSTSKRTMVPEDLMKVLEYAAFQGCTMVRFDVDGEVIEGLPIYVW